MWLQVLQKLCPHGVETGLLNTSRQMGQEKFSSDQEMLAEAILEDKVECHPYLSQASLLSHCRSVGVCMTAYSPLGSGDRPWASADEPRLLDDPKLGAIAEKYQKTAAQVVLRWQVQRGVVCVPKSVTPSRILQNLQVCDFSLSEEDVRQVEALGRGERYIVPAVEVRHAGPDSAGEHSGRDGSLLRPK
ncbi:unnamed protein product [Arctogadus glacialis]